VPVIVPEDTVAALTLLADQSVQKECSVHHEDCYLSASKHFCSEVACTAASVQEVGIGIGCVNETKVRHHP